MAAIEISGLSKDYAIGFWRKRFFRALDKLTLQVEQGEVFGFLGPNGAGKTTTLKILTGLIFPTEGTATILGHPAGEPAAFLHTGFLPENPYFYDYLTPEELLDYFARLFPLPAAERRRRRDAVLEQVGLAEARAPRLRNFSKGLWRGGGFPRATWQEREIVLRDEPMSGLDPVGRHDVRELILQLKAAGKTVFFSTHILSDAEALCDRVAILNRGRLVGVGQVSELLRQQANYEAVLECVSAEALSSLKPMAANEPLVTGGQCRIVIPEQELRRFLAFCQSDGLRLVSLNPVRLSLEDYFVEVLRDTDRNRPPHSSP